MPPKKATKQGKQVAKVGDSCPSTPNGKKHPENEEPAPKVNLVSPSPNKPKERLALVDSTPATKLFTEEDESPVDSMATVMTGSSTVSRIQVPKNATKVYKIINKATGSLGGNGSTGAIYGELTIGSMQKVINVLKGQCAMTCRSRFIDVGAGLGKPNFHAAQDPQVRVSVGIELEDIRWQLSMQNLSFVTKHVQEPQETAANLVTPVTVRQRPAASKVKQGASAVVSADLEEDTPAPEEIAPAVLPVQCAVNFISNDIDEAGTLDPFTHIYMYDLGFPPSLQESIARKFNSSVHARYLVSYRAPRLIIDAYHYHVESVCHINTTMFGKLSIHVPCNAMLTVAQGLVRTTPHTSTSASWMRGPRRASAAPSSSSRPSLCLRGPREPSALRDRRARTRTRRCTAIRCSSAVSPWPQGPLLRWLPMQR